jgi:hypothetical protein
MDMDPRQARMRVSFFFSSCFSGADRPLYIYIYIYIVDEASLVE